MKEKERKAMKKFYEKPTQVRFLENEHITDEPHWIGGIAFEDKVICGECGAVIELNDIEAIVELHWISISDEILGTAM